MALPDTLEVVTFMADGHRFAVEARLVRTQTPAKNSAASTAAEQLLGLPGAETQNDGTRRTLVMKYPAGEFSVTVSAPVELLELKINAIHPLPPLIAARTTLTGLRGLATGTEGVMMLVDFQAAKPVQT